MQLTFSSFNTEAGYDYVIVYDGPSTTALASLSGVNMPAVTRSRTNVMAVRFVSDISVQSTGFVASAMFVPALCQPQATVTANNTVISVRNYYNSMACTWQVTAPAGMRISVTFSALATQANRDIVSLTSSGRTLSFSGNSLPAPLMTASNTLAVAWSSDATVTNSGFALTVVFVR